jgi:hypothetical protein
MKSKIINPDDLVVGNHFVILSWLSGDSSWVDGGVFRVVEINMPTVLCELFYHGHYDQVTINTRNVIIGEVSKKFITKLTMMYESPIKALENLKTDIELSGVSYSEAWSERINNVISRMNFNTKELSCSQDTE